MEYRMRRRIIFSLAMMVCIALGGGNARAIENKSRVVSPYWQSDTTSYTFIGISHTSLFNMASQIGLTLRALQKDTNTFGSVQTFTITSGSTQRVFIVRSGHPTINATNIPTAVFIVGTTDFQHGSVLIEPVATNPEVRANGGFGGGYRDVTMLSLWGAVVIEQNTTGFSMEFIGDLQDSAATTTMDNTAIVSGVN